MRILHVITSLRTGGAEKLMTELLPRMKECGEDVELCVFDGVRTPFYEELEQKGMKITSLHCKGGIYSLWNAFLLIPIIRHYDIVHTHNSPAQFSVAFANLFVHTKLITTEHSTNNRRRGKWWLKPIDRWLYKQYEYIISVSDLAAENIKSYIGIDGIKTVTVPNGINVREYEQALESGDIIKNFVGGKSCVMVAGFRYEKDQMTVIRAHTLLPNNYHLFLVGDGEKRGEIEKLISSLGLDSRIHLLGVRKDVKELLKSVDVIIMSSHREGLSLSSLEGMASGKPFIASDVEGLRDIVGGYGILFPHEDYKTLASEIKKVCEDKEYSGEVVKKCQERARMFDISIMVKKYLDVYKNMNV